MKKILKFIKYFFTFLLILTIGLIIGFSIYFYPKIKTLYLDASSKVSNIKENTFRSAETSLLYDNKDNVITKLRGIKDSYYLTYDKIPDNFKYAFIAVEDRNFLKHNGIDYKATLASVYELIMHRGEIVRGGSTITQQLARGTFLNYTQSYSRKIEEIFISYQLEKKYNKNELLEYYINSINFANGTYGVEAASRKYFNKTSSELNLAQITFLSAIPNNPTLYDPFKHFENTTKRQHKILNDMKLLGYITNQEYNDAMKTIIKLNPQKFQKHDYIETFILDDATKTLMKINGFDFKYNFKNDTEKNTYEKEYDDEYSKYQKTLYSGGYRIYTSIDMKKQDLLQQAVDSNLSSFKSQNKEGIYEFQGAATSIDNETGKVVAIVGGRSQNFSGYTLNRAFQSFRQPGSSFKPIIVYTPAFEKGFTPDSIINDTKLADGPKNYTGRYQGPITIRRAVQQSVNTVAWQLLNNIGPEKGLSYVKNMHFRKIVDRDNNLASSLGGLTYGVSTLEMASAYSTIERDGYFYEPTAITKITSADGKIVYNDSTEPIQIYTTKAAQTMTDVLRSVMTGGTGAKLQLSNMPTAGKTGTTNDSKDGWFAGFTPYYTTVVWCGYDIPKTLDSLAGSSYPGRIWKQYMQKIHEGLAYKDFKINVSFSDNNSTSNDKIKAEEQKKVLIDEIDKQMNIYLNKDINSLKDIESLEQVYKDLINKLNLLKDATEKNNYIGKINVRKQIIDTKKKEFEDALKQTPTNETTTDENNNTIPQDNTNSNNSTNSSSNSEINQTQSDKN